MAQLKEPDLREFLRGIGIVRLDSVGAVSASGAGMDENALNELSKKGDPIKPSKGIVREDPLTVARLFNENTEEVCFPLTPDGHLSSHEPLVFNADRAVEQVIAILPVDMEDEDREEALAATWMNLAFHDADHPADMGGLLFDAFGRARCCYVDVKLTQGSKPKHQRARLEHRASERKLGLIALTVTKACDGGFRGYPGVGQPGLVVTLLCNHFQVGRKQAGYAVNWYFALSSNYQASQARWGWGGSDKVKLPDELCDLLRKRTVKLDGKPTDLLQLLIDFKSYDHFRKGDDWDRPRLKATLQAKAIAARYLLMHEDTLDHAQASAESLQPDGVTIPIDVEEFQPGDAIAAYYGKMCQVAVNERQVALNERQVALNERQVALNERQVALNERNALAQRIRRLVERHRQSGHADEQIAEDLGYSLADFLQLFPRP